MAVIRIIDESIEDTVDFISLSQFRAKNELRRDKIVQSDIEETFSGNL